MSHVVTLLAELFLIGCLHMIVTMLVDFSKMPLLGKIFTVACYLGAVFILGRFIAINLVPQMASIFRMIL